MNRFLGLSGIIHVAIFAGIIYFCATYDYSTPNKMDKADLDVKAANAVLPTQAEPAPAIKEVSARPQEKIDTNPTAKLDKTAKDDLKAIEKFEKKMAEKKKEIPKVLPKAKIARQESDKPSEEGVTQAQEDIHIPVVAPVEEDKSAQQQAERDQFEQDRAELAKQSDDEKKALLAKLKSLNTQAEEKSRAEQAAKETQPSGTAVATTHARPNEGESVKGIEEFKQVAGNPVPSYDQDDRIKNRQGTVVFQAYVTKEGSPQEFDLIESSGHRSLDYKTLKALKQWKFEPGQEGWVEIPFRWDLKGGPQELPSTLRKKAASQNPGKSL